MSYFHVYITYKNAEGVIHNLFWHSYQEETLVNYITTPFNERKFFWFAGFKVHKDNITRILIFSSEDNADKIILPNGKVLENCGNQDVSYLVEIFGKGRVKGVHNVTAKYILPFNEQNDGKKSSNELTLQKTKRIFIVHGRDENPVNDLKGILKELGLKPIILHEQPSKGMTIIEKLEEYSDVQFAFIILTPDDSAIGKYEWTSCLRSYFKKIGASVDEIKDNLDHLIFEQNVAVGRLYNELHKDRSRQNVILEFGYFLGILGRSKVCCLYKGDIELPSDMHGICYLHFNDSINEVKNTILEELKAANILTA
jgi:predicted nucleotide-binding protein